MAIEIKEYIGYQPKQIDNAKKSKKDKVKNKTTKIKDKLSK